MTAPRSALQLYPGQIGIELVSFVPMPQVLAVQPLEPTYEPQQLLNSSMQPVYPQVAQISSASSPCWAPVALTATQILQPQYIQQPALQVSQVQLQPPAAAVALALAQPGAQWMPQASAMPATVFFAGVTPVADSQRLRLLFAQFGRVLDLNLFRPYNGCRTSKVGNMPCLPFAARLQTP